MKITPEQRIKRVMDALKRQVEQPRQRQKTNEIRALVNQLDAIIGRYFRGELQSVEDNLLPSTGDLRPVNRAVHHEKQRANEITSVDLENQLRYFSRMNLRYGLSDSFPNHLLTNGTHFLAEIAGAYWLMDTIASYHDELHAWPFQVWKLTVDGNKAVLTCGDEKNNVLVTRKMDNIDFPLANITLLCEQSEDPYWVIMLPSEH